MQCVSGPGPDGPGEKGLLPVSALPAVLPRHPRGRHLRLPQGLHQVRLPCLSASFTDSQLLVVTWTSGNFALGPAARRTTSWTESPWSLIVFLLWRPCWPRGVAKPPCKTDSAPPLYKENAQMFQKEVAPPSGLEWKPTGRRRARPHRDWRVLWPWTKLFCCILKFIHNVAVSFCLFVMVWIWKLYVLYCVEKNWSPWLKSCRNEVLLTAYSDTFLLPHLKDLSSQEVVVRIVVVHSETRQKKTTVQIRTKGLGVWWKLKGFYFSLSVSIQLFLQYLQFLYFHFSEDDSFQTLWVKSPSLSQVSQHSHMRGTEVVQVFAFCTQLKVQILV